MSRFIEKLVAASPVERRKFSVLGEDIYVRPMTRKAMAEAMATVPKDVSDRDPDYVGLFLIVHCAEAQDGSKLFAITEIDQLRERVSLKLLQEIEAGVLGALSPTDEQIEEDLKADPLSASA